MLTRREFLSIPVLQGWFNDDPLEQRIIELENSVQATQETLRLTLSILQELAQVMNSNTVYFENRMDEIESRLPPPQKKKVVV